MLKKISLGKSPFNELYQVFKMDSAQELEKKRARLFPVGNADSETSTVSIFLSSLSAVKEYREELLTVLGVKKIKNKNINLHTYTEIAGGNENDRPDGLIVITSGKNNPIIEWAGFVEAKVGNNLLTEEQIERYVEFAREIGINDIITLSNYLTTSPLDCPVKSKKTKFNLAHWSWTYLKVVANRLIKGNHIEDEDHIFILKELVRYFDTHKNLFNYKHLGKEWKENVQKIHTYTESQTIEKDVLDGIIESFKQEEKDISLQLSDRTDNYVELIVKGNREQELMDMMQKTKKITSQYVLDGDKNRSFFIDVCFKSRTVRCYTQYALHKGKAQAQTSHLLKLLDGSGVTDDIKINAYYIRNKSNLMNRSLSDLNREKEQGDFYSILDKSLGDEVKYFEIEVLVNASKSFTSSKNFIILLEDSAELFVNQVMNYLK